MAHDHCHCKHELKYCEHCDVVYCTKCNREWGSHIHWWTYTYPYYTYKTGDSPDYTITSGGTQTSYCTHHS